MGEAKRRAAGLPDGSEPQKEPIYNPLQHMDLLALHIRAILYHRHGLMNSW